MNLQNFETQVSGKWILAGEHAVLRGYPALVFPLRSRYFRLNFVHADQNLKLQFGGEKGSEFEALFWSVLERACTTASLSREHLKGILTLESTIPIGAGLGASAALCVALTRWFHHMGVVREGEQYDFARDLENLFHGESSGVDIAVALFDRGLRFLRNGDRAGFEPLWTPRCYISFSGKRGVTLDCVARVKSLIEKNPKETEKIDADMGRAVLAAQSALVSYSQDGLGQLKRAIELAQSCFERWGLVSEEPRAHIECLKSAGAVAVKLTGSGDGGFVLSLWENEPPAELQGTLISCF